MKILFVAEVFPMRNSFTEHSLVAREFLINISKLLNQFDVDSGDARLLCNNQIIDLVFEDYMKFLPSVIRLRNETSIFFESQLKDWSIDGLNSWNEYVGDKGLASKKIKEELNYIKETIFDFDMIVFWGENGALDSFSRSVDIPCIHIELSSTRKPFFEGRTVDCLGANGSASFRNIEFKDLEKNLNPPSVDFWPAYYNIEGESKPDFLGFDDSSLTYWEEDHTLEIFKNGKNKTALIGLQLFDDANTQRHSSFSSPLDFLQKNIPKLTEAGWDIIVKTHPGAIHRPVNFLEQNKALSYAKSFTNCYIYEHKNDNRNYLSLLRSVDLVVVINSSMGFEASLLGKTVVLEGEALYSIKGIYPSLDMVLNDKFNRDEYLRKLSYLTYFFSKYVFIKPNNFEQLDFYTAILKYWEENKQLLLESQFPVERYIKGFEQFSKNFLNTNSNLEFNEYPSLLEAYSVKTPRKEEAISYMENVCVFTKEKVKVPLVYNKTRFNIDSLNITNKDFFIEGWAFNSESILPAVMVCIITDDTLLHVGRVSQRRQDVQDVFELQHSLYGFKFKLEIMLKPKDLKLLFVYQDGNAELIQLEK
ncbi:hypothetical protein PSEHALCIP103_02539 [Pseudoalteromonas haloplanktis]|uniref:Capsule polysaccharide biosynthesis protein n=1 Tax=Pseudoalteromonas haloplanktis TaxID=228 RepID=A0A9W4R0U9_PSEHA|nr:capsular biosynthesis protein [Pseudoalteromonas haloplanktis]CAH9061654.1 hypothetical protein PSEHALCIP103_02539 [Pseudoalteromonas haloplanktis]